MELLLKNIQVPSPRFNFSQSKFFPIFLQHNPHLLHANMVIPLLKIHYRNSIISFIIWYIHYIILIQYMQALVFRKSIPHTLCKQPGCIPQPFHKTVLIRFVDNEIQIIPVFFAVPADTIVAFPVPSTFTISGFLDSYVNAPSPSVSHPDKTARLPLF